MTTRVTADNAGAPRVYKGETQKAWRYVTYLTIGYLDRAAGSRRPAPGSPLETSRG
jgi:hypothetical protein